MHRAVLRGMVVQAFVALPVALAGQPPFYADKMDLMAYVDADGRRRAVRTPADWLKRRAHIVANMQLVMGPMPPDSKRVPLDLEVEESVELGKVTRRRITFATEPGDRVSAYLFTPREREGRGAAVLCLHQTTAVGKGEPAGVGGKPSLRYALELARRGYVTLAPDYPNYGGYQFDPYAHGYASATMKGIWNHMRAVDLLVSLPQVDPDRIGCIGHSLGGHNTLFLAVFDTRIKAMVSSCGFNSFSKYYGGNLAGWSHRGYMPRIATAYGKDPARMPFDFTEVVGALAPRALFVNAPLRDGNFDVSGVRDCITAATPVYALLGAPEKLVAVYPDAGHDFPEPVRVAAYAFLDRVLSHEPSANDADADRARLVIDVRTPQEYASGHLRDAVNIPYDRIGSEIAQHAPDKKQRIVLYCHSGRRAGIALDVLERMGYENVVNAGGYEEARRQLAP